LEVLPPANRRHPLSVFEAACVKGRLALGLLSIRRIIDPTYPIEDHFRWKVERELVAAFERGDDFQVTCVDFATHGFTHIEAPRHMLPDRPTTSGLLLESLVGDAPIVNLSNIADKTAISALCLLSADPASHFLHRFQRPR